MTGIGKRKHANHGKNVLIKEHRTLLPGREVRPRTICWSEPQMLVVTTLRIAPWSHLRFWRSDLWETKSTEDMCVGVTISALNLITAKKQQL